MKDISALPTAGGKNPLAANDDEARWIAAAQASPNAFEPLYLRYRGRVYHYLRTRLNNDEDAADATQQVFLQALKALPKYKQRGIPFAVWLFRIAHHLADQSLQSQCQYSIVAGTTGASSQRAECRGECTSAGDASPSSTLAYNTRPI